MRNLTCLILLQLFAFSGYSADYWTIMAGDWGDNIWSTTSHVSPTCSCSPSCNFNKTAYIAHNVEISDCGATFKTSGGGEIYLQGGNLTINANLESNGGSFINIPAGDTLWVYGDVTLSGNSDMNVDGVLKIVGDLNNGGGEVCGTGTASISGIVSNLGNFCLGYVLPIELVDFRANLMENVVQIRWTTASETENDYFTVERSADLENWEVITTIPGAGNSSTPINYLETDFAPLDGLSYYRLKQTDFDGQYAYSGIVPIDKQPNGQPGMRVFPNPGAVGEDLHVELSNMAKKSVFMVLRDLKGNEVYSKVTVVVSDLIIEAIPIERDIKPGVYFVTASSENRFYNQKIIIK